MPGTIIGESLQVNGNLNIWTSATITSSGIVSANTFRDYNYTGGFALVSNTNKDIVETVITSAELNYLDTVSANIQTQLGNISALDAAKVPLTTTITAGTMLSGGGSLAANRTISHQTVGTSGTYSNIVTNSTGHITSARNIISADIPQLPATKIFQDISNRFVSDIQINNWTSTSATVASNSANWNTAYTSAHNHSNKSTLDLINQSLNTSASVNFKIVNVSAQPSSTYDLTSPPSYFGQDMAVNDNWKIYGEGTSDNGTLVFEVGDNSDESFLWAVRNTSGTRTGIMELTQLGLILSGDLDLDGVVRKYSAGTVLDLQNITLDNITQNNTVGIRGNSNTNTGYIKFGHPTSGGAIGYNGAWISVDKPLVGDFYASFAGLCESERGVYQLQEITSTASWDAKANKDISNAGSAYTITLPAEYADTPFYVTTSTLSNTVTLQRSSSDLIYLNGASGATSISLSANKYYNVIYRPGRWYVTG